MSSSSSSYSNSASNSDENQSSSKCSQQFEQLSNIQSPPGFRPPSRPQITKSSIRISAQLGHSSVLNLNPDANSSQSSAVVINNGLEKKSLSSNLLQQPNIINPKIFVNQKTPCSLISPDEHKDVNELEQFLEMNTANSKPLSYSYTRTRFKKIGYQRSNMTNVILNQLERESKFMHNRVEVKREAIAVKSPINERSSPSISSTFRKNFSTPITTTKNSLNNQINYVFEKAKEINNQISTVNKRKSQSQQHQQQQKQQQVQQNLQQKSINIPQTTRSLTEIAQPTFSLEKVINKRSKERLINSIKCKDSLISGQKQKMFQKPTPLTFIPSSPFSYLILKDSQSVQTNQFNTASTPEKMSKLNNRYSSSTSKLKRRNLFFEEIPQEEDPAQDENDSESNIRKKSQTCFENTHSSAIQTTNQSYSVKVDDYLSSNEFRGRSMTTSRRRSMGVKYSVNKSIESVSSVTKRPVEEFEKSPLNYLLRKYPDVIKNDYQFMKMKAKNMIDPYIQFIEGTIDPSQLHAEQKKTKNITFLNRKLQLNIEIPLRQKNNIITTTEISPIKKSTSLTRAQKEVFDQMDLLKMELSMSKKQISQLSFKNKLINKSLEQAKKMPTMMALDYNVSDFIYRNYLKRSTNPADNIDKSNAIDQTFPSSYRVDTQ